MVIYFTGNPLKLIKKDEYGIGHFISTKAIGRWERDDITSTYKYAEKSHEERATMLKALKQANSAFSRYYLNEEFNEVNFRFNVMDDIKIGEDFNVVIRRRTFVYLDISCDVEWTNRQLSKIIIY